MLYLQTLANLVGIVVAGGLAAIYFFTRINVLQVGRYRPAYVGLNGALGAHCAYVTCRLLIQGVDISFVHVFGMLAAACYYLLTFNPSRPAAVDEAMRTGHGDLSDH